MEVKKYLFLIGICSLFFCGIPIRVNQNTEEKEKKLFKKYIRDFNKTYSKNDTEYLVRFENFRKSLQQIEKLNSNRVGNESALYGLTVFSDLSQDEFIKKRLQANIGKYLMKHVEYRILSDANEIDAKERLRRSTNLPIKVDWRERGIIGEVHNQKTCGACWAFSTIETIEAINALKNRSLVELSVQEAIDCAQFGNYGCEGGDSCSLLNWLAITKTKITSEKKYPFTYKTDTCKMKNPKVGVQVKSFTCNTYVGMEEKIIEELAYHGPVAAAVNALNWQYYLGGIIQFHCSGSPRNLNHAVQIVGYDKSGPVPFYIARNSWGKIFGDNGYIYIAIGGNICGLANEVTSVDVV